MTDGKIVCRGCLRRRCCGKTVILGPRNGGQSDALVVVDALLRPPATRGHFRSEPDMAVRSRYYCIFYGMTFTLFDVNESICTSSNVRELDALRPWSRPRVRHMLATTRNVGFENPNKNVQIPQHTSVFSQILVKLPPNMWTSFIPRIGFFHEICCNIPSLTGCQMLCL